MKLTLENIITKKKYVFDELTDSGTSKLYYNFVINIPETADDGEYKYELYDGIELVETGLCQVGNFNGNNKEYEGNKKERKQYGKK